MLDNFLFFFTFSLPSFLFFFLPVIYFLFCSERRKYISPDALSFRSTSVYFSTCQCSTRNKTLGVINFTPNYRATGWPSFLRWISIRTPWDSVYSGDNWRRDLEVKILYSLCKVRKSSWINWPKWAMCISKPLGNEEIIYTGQLVGIFRTVNWSLVGLGMNSDNRNACKIITENVMKDGHLQDEEGDRRVIWRWADELEGTGCRNR